MSAAPKLTPQTNTQLTVKLTVLQGPHAGQRFSFSKNKITIGRSPENDIILVNDPLISRQHAYIEVVENDVEIVNLSQKNPILVNNESVNKWKLTNDTVFLVGASEFSVQIENAQSVVIVKPQASSPVEQIQTPLTVVKNSTAPSATPVKPVQPVAKVKSQAHNLATVKPKSLQQPVKHQASAPRVFAQMPHPNLNLHHHPKSSFESPSKTKFYIIIGLVLAVGLYLGLSDSGSGARKAKKSTLKYSDEIALKLNSAETAENLRKQEAQLKIKQSSSFMRAEENFNKGMRAFQLNDFSSAIDYFQLTLVSQPEHILAKRYLFLSRVRFDEILKAKIELGQSYFQSHNFKLCMAMYQQVMDMLAPKEMLQGSVKDTNLQLAQTMYKKCEFAAEGIR